MRDIIHTANQRFNAFSIEKRFYLSVAMALTIAFIGAFVFHSVAFYFIGCGVLILLRRV